VICSSYASPARKGVSEDGWVRGDANDGVLINGPRESTGFDQLAREVVDPDALAERRQLLQAGGVHCDLTPTTFRSKGSNDMSF